jgi:hypothetical protein
MSLGNLCRTCRFVAVLALAGFWCATIVDAAAQSGAPAAQAAPELSRYVASEAHQRAVTEAARRTNDLLPDSCKTMQFQPTGLLRVNKAVQFDAQGHPSDGAWSEPVNGAGCGTTKRYNVMTVVSGNQPPREVGLLPGTTNADPFLQRDSVLHAFVGTARYSKDCKQRAITDTRFDAFEGEAVKNALHGANARPWREVWTVWACGSLVDVVIHFTPDDKGTGIAVRPEEAKLRH